MYTAVAGEKPVITEPIPWWYNSNLGQLKAAMEREKTRFLNGSPLQVFDVPPEAAMPFVAVTQTNASEPAKPVWPIRYDDVDHWGPGKSPPQDAPIPMNAPLYPAKESTLSQTAENTIPTSATNLDAATQ